MLRKPSGWATAAVLALLAGGAATAGSAADFSTIYGFAGSPDGSAPAGALIRDATGALYGTTGVGGQPGCFGYGCGTVFKLTPPASSGGTWTEEILYRFTGGADGAFPVAPLVIDSVGALYGEASDGGNPNCLGGYNGCGVVFKLTPPASPGGAWSETVVHTFSGSDGGTPVGGLVFDAAGALYGVTPFNSFVMDSGNKHCGSLGCGVVFKLIPPAIAGGPWTETVLHAFTGCTDGSVPEGGLAFDAAGALYGTTYASSDCGILHQMGTVYQLVPPPQPGGSWTFSTLHAFTSSDGAEPSGSLVFDAAGALYGATGFGGIGNCADEFQGCGTIFKLSPPPSPGGTRNLSTLYAFSGGADGGVPALSPAFDVSGALYGVTGFGGTITGPCSSYQGCGVVFKLTPSAIAGGSWIESVLYSFTGASDGGFPSSVPILDGAGSLYGTTDGPSGNGTVFKLTGLEVTATLSVAVTGRGVVTSSPPGIDCGEGRTACTASFPLASQVQLLPSFRRNAIFLGWNGDCHGRGACVVMMNADQSVGASFRPIR